MSLNSFPRHQPDTAHSLFVSSSFSQMLWLPNSCLLNIQPPSKAYKGQTNRRRTCCSTIQLDIMSVPNQPPEWGICTGAKSYMGPEPMRTPRRTDAQQKVRMYQPGLWQPVTAVQSATPAWIHINTKGSTHGHRSPSNNLKLCSTSPLQQSMPPDSCSKTAAHVQDVHGANNSM